MPSWRGANGLYAARKLGLVAGLQLVLDAGDAASAPSSPTKWLDLSGNGYDFELGADSTHPGGDEPTLNGTPGQLAAGNYFAHDGADYFTYDSANEAWMNNVHKDNALFTFAAWYLHGAAGSGRLMGTRSSPTSVGFEVALNGTPSTIRFTVSNGSVNSLAADSGLSLDVGAWHFLGCSIDESVGTDGLVFCKNGLFSSQTSTYTSPSASAATHTAQIGAGGGGGAPIRAGSRLAMVTAWEGRALRQGELVALFNATRGRFGV